MDTQTESSRIKTHRYAWAGMAKMAGIALSLVLSFFILGLFGYKEPLLGLLLIPRFSMVLALITGLCMVLMIGSGIVGEMLSGEGVPTRYRSIWMPMKAVIGIALVLPMGQDNISALSTVLAWALEMGAALAWVLDM